MTMAASLSKTSMNTIRKSPVFEDINRFALKRLAKSLEVIHKKQSETIFNEGQLADGLFIVDSGEIHIIQKNSAAPITTLASGSIFGELALLDDTPMSAGAVAASEARLILLRGETLANLINTHPTLGGKIVLNLAKLLGQRIKHANAGLATARRELEKLKSINEEDHAERSESGK